MTDHAMEITEPVWRGDDAASDRSAHDFYETHWPALLRFVLQFTNGDRDRAEDIVQETLLRAWRRPEARTPDGGWSRPWLFTVARNFAIDVLRTTGRTVLVGEWTTEPGDPVDHMSGVLDTQEVRAAIRSLPERLRGVLIEVYFRDRPGVEVAAALGIPVGTVRSRTFHALRALRDVLASKGFFER